MRQKTLRDKIIECISGRLDYSGVNEHNERYCLLTGDEIIDCPFLLKRVIKVPNIPYDQIMEDGEYVYETKHHRCNKIVKEER